MNSLAVRRWPLAAFLLLAACASTPPPPPPTLTEVPGGVLEAFCTRLRDEGFSTEQTLEVVRTTQPLITPQSMSGLAEAASYTRGFDAVAAADAANGGVALPVVVPKGSCAWRGVAATARRSSDTLTVELSAPFVNPFVRNSFGLFARVSLAREAATWYWVPLAARDGRWTAGTPILLGVR